VDRFYIYGSSLFLAQSGVPVHSVLPLLSVGQILEIPAMLLLGTILMRFGIRNLLVMGVASNIARYFFFIISEGNPTLMVCGILFHGLAYTFFFSSAAILLDSHSHVRNRAGVHQIFNVLTLGLGSLAGSLLAGGMGKLLRTANGLSVDFDRFWSVALGLCVVNLFLLVFLAGKGEKNGGKNPPQSWLEAE
jgi:MFS family permease